MENISPIMNEAYLRLVNLSKNYVEGGKPREVLVDVSINFCEGEFSAILGKSGTGKTTLLNLISGIDQPDSGKIFLGQKLLTGMADIRITKNATTITISLENNSFLNELYLIFIL